MAKPEYVSPDILDEEYIKSFAPFHYVQMALGSCRIDIRDRFVSPPTILQKLYTTFCVIVTLVLYIYATKTYFVRFYYFGAVYYTSISSIILYYLTFLCNSIHIRFINSDSNSKFYIQLQEVDRIMKVHKNYKINKIMFNINAISVLSSIVTLVIAFCVTIYENFSFTLGFVGLLYSVVICTIEWLYCANLMIGFFIRIRFINSIIKNHLKGSPSLKPTRFRFTEHFMRCLASETHDFETSCTDHYLKVVLEGFTTFQNHYRFQMMLFCNQFVLLSLLTFETGISALQNNTLRYTEIVVLPTILILNMILALFICIRCEAFFREVKLTRHLCIALLSKYQEGPFRLKAKRMLQIIEEHPGKFNIYNMWCMNALTIIKMLNIVTTMMVALLQFAYL